MPLAVGRAFAEALDADDFPSARRLLRRDAVYARGDRTFRGARNIVSSYRRSSEWAKKRLDEIRYESSVRRLKDGRVRIIFVDRLRVGKRRHTHRSAQVLTLDVQGRIARIVHADIGNGKAKVMKFLRDCGIGR